MAAAHLGARRRARHARGPRRGAGARAPHAVLHRGLVDELRGHLRRRPADPRPRVVLRLHAERERPDRRSPGRHEPLRADPGARRRLDRARRRGRRRRPARRGGRRPGDRADRGGIRIDRPRSERIVVRRTVGPADFAEDLHSWQGGALGPAHTLRQSAFLRGTQPIAPRARTAVRRRVERARASASRCA